MTAPEKRILEIYTILLINRIRKENINALKQLRAFFYCLSYTEKYDPDFLYETLIENIEAVEKLPTRQEVGLAVYYRAQNPVVKLKKSQLKGLFRGIPSQRSISFSEKVALMPKIRDRTGTFHQQLLLFYQEFVRIGKSIPI